MSAPVIENYGFGRIEIDGNVYHKDVIIFSDHVQSNWRREKGHSLVLADLETVIEAKPEILIVGCGAYGRMNIPDSTLQELNKRSIQIQHYRTTKAVERYSQIREVHKVVAALHLTC